MDQAYHFLALSGVFTVQMRVPYLRTPAYLVSWAAILAIGFQVS